MFVKILIQVVFKTTSMSLYIVLGLLSQWKLQKIISRIHFFEKILSNSLGFFTSKTVFGSGGRIKRRRKNVVYICSKFFKNKIRFSNTQVLL